MSFFFLGFWACVAVASYGADGGLNGVSPSFSIIDKSEHNPIKANGFPAWGQWLNVKTGKSVALHLITNSFCAGGGFLSVPCSNVFAVVSVLTLGAAALQVQRHACVNGGQPNHVN